MILTLPPARPSRPDSPQPAYAELGMRSNFSFLDGASHPAELAQRAKALGLAGFGLCDQQGLAGAVRGHVAAKEAGLRYAVGSRLTLEDGAQYLVWPTDRASYGRLTTLLSRGRMAAPKGECHLAREAFYEAAEGWVVAALPPVGWDGGDEAVAPQVRRQGWSLVNQELEEGLVSIAAPITDRAGQTVAALNISGQANRSSAKVMQETMLPQLRAAAQAISSRLGLQRN